MVAKDIDDNTEQNIGEDSINIVDIMKQKSSDRNSKCSDDGSPLDPKDRIDNSQNNDEPTVGDDGNEVGDEGHCVDGSEAIRTLANQNPCQPDLLPIRTLANQNPCQPDLLPIRTPAN
jgi:hypothetical protein